MAGDATSAGYGGHAAAQRRYGVAFANSGQVGADHLRGGRHRDEAIRVTPGGGVSEIGRVGPQGRGRGGSILVGLRTWPAKALLAP